MALTGTLQYAGPGLWKIKPGFLLKLVGPQGQALGEHVGPAFVSEDDPLVTFVQLIGNG